MKHSLVRQAILTQRQYSLAAGFDSVWIPDSQLLWRDTFVALALAAASTKRITLAPGVTNLVTRHVTVVASAVRTIQELAPGRFTLALGAGRSAADMAGAAHTPTRELAESLRALRALLSGQPWSFAGRPQRLTGAAGTYPVYLGAGGPRNVRLAGAEADGIILAGMLPCCLALMRPSPVHAATGATAGAPHSAQALGLSPGALQVLLAVAGVGCCIAMAMPMGIIGSAYSWPPVMPCHMKSACRHVSATLRVMP